MLHFLVFDLKAKDVLLYGMIWLKAIKICVYACFLITFSLLSWSFKMYEEDKTTRCCLHRDTMTVSGENIFISVANGFASWVKPLNKESARHRKAIHYSVQLIVICIGLVCAKWLSTVFRNVAKVDFFSDLFTLPDSGLKFTFQFKLCKRTVYFYQYRKIIISLGPGAEVG